MCGIAGGARGAGRGDLAEALTRQAQTIRHRGPDGSGTWISPGGEVGFAHRRLAIVDLSELGAQPMSSLSGRFTITFNGEIYNFKRLRKELEAEGAQFRGGSDTEVMLAAFESWGVEEATQRFIGMFAFAVWDGKERVLHLVRDRVGVKPLYYGWSRGGLLFGSELKAVLGEWGEPPAISAEATRRYLSFGYVPAPYSIYEKIWKLPPGSILTLSASQLQTPPPAFSPEVDAARSAPHSFWRLAQVVESGRERGDPDRVNDLERLLSDAVGLRMIADVPLGVFLSGGIDSSLVLALMQRQSSQPARSFSIGFREEAYNEASYAREVAKALGSDHTEFFVTPEECRRVVPDLPDMYDEPFADSSQIPTHLLSVLARQQVTVALSGDGGDELFGGYPRYQVADSIWRILRVLPQPLRTLLNRVQQYVPRAVWRALLPLFARLVSAELGAHRREERFERARKLLAMSSRREVYLNLIQFWGKSDLAAVERRIPARIADSYEEFLFMDTEQYLPDDILVKVDRASMRVGLEVREPLLDHRVIEFAWSLPRADRGAGGAPKQILKTILGRHLDPALFNRPKMGFGVPLDEWLRGPLRSWGEELLSADSLASHEYFSLHPVREVWEQHQRGEVQAQNRLWLILMFQAWYQRFRSSAGRGK